MKRTLLCVAAIAALSTAGCSAVPALAGSGASGATPGGAAPAVAAQTPVPTTTSGRPSATPSPEPTEHATGVPLGDPFEVVRFDTTITLPDGVTVTTEPLVGHRPGKPNPDPAVFDADITRKGAPLTAMRVHIENHSGVPWDVETLRLRPLRDGETTHVLRNIVGDSDVHGANLADGGTTDVTLVVEGDVDQEWMLGLLRSNGNGDVLGILGVFTSQEWTPDTLTHMGLGPSIRQRIGKGDSVPLLGGKSSSRSGS